ncbi:MAG: hypothetical protein RQ751_12240 [Longimicrobiales bacterium]|nr:hypothetical protein [Longimicrobiales bacterium]
MDEQEPRDPMAELARRHYHPPPATPRDEIWTGLEARIAADALERARTRRAARPALLQAWRRRPWGIAAAAAVGLVSLGIGIGRLASPPPGRDPGMAAGDPGTTGAARAAGAGGVETGRWAVLEHLTRSEPLLAMVKSDMARGGLDEGVASWARELLGETRFLMNSGVAFDPEMASLLEDLELVLLQVTLAGGAGIEEERAREERALLVDGMEARNVLTRIQVVVPRAGVAGI